jgi:two-component system, LytTR family, sensor histidine kinase AlgZ
MIDGADQPMSNLPETPQRLPSHGSFAVRAIWIVSISTLLVFLIFLSLGHIRLSQSGQSIIGSLVYTAFIALPSMFLLTRLSLCYSARFPRLIILMQALVLICTATVGTFAGSLVLLYAGLVHHGAYWLELRAELPFCTVIALIFGLSISTFETMRYKLQAASLELRTREVERERAYKLLAEARLSSLESRIHPHFLFNTLNSIAALIPSNPQLAEDTVGKLASLLRFSLNANHAGLVPLSQELKVVREYLEMERTRFGDRIRFEIAVPADLDDVSVPPLAIQSLVENVVKHVVSRQPQGAEIQIAGSRESKRIQIRVIDDGPGFSLDAITPDHGLGNLIARMELLYGPAGQLEVARENDKTVVRLSFPA